MQSWQLAYSGWQKAVAKGQLAKGSWQLAKSNLTIKQFNSLEWHLKYIQKQAI
jgi:hypothetical protein